MKTPININPITDPVIEEHILSLKNEIEAYASVQAKGDATKDTEISKEYFRIQILNNFKSLTQKTIYFIKARLLNLASIGNATEAQQIADVENAVIDNQVKDLTHEHANAKARRNSLSVNHWKRKYAKWVMLFVLAVGAFDGLIMLFNIASGGYGLLLSLLAATTLTAIISFSHLIYRPWVQKATITVNKLGRLFWVFGGAFLIFWMFGNIRAMAANNNIDVAVDSNTINNNTHVDVSGVMIALISFSAFILVHFITKLIHRTPDELKAEEEYKRLSKEMEAISKKIDELNKEKKENASVPFALKQEARVKYNMWQTAVAQCTGIATGGVITYHQMYTRYNPVIPAFFNDDIHFDFDTSIDFPHQP